MNEYPTYKTSADVEALVVNNVTRVKINAALGESAIALDQVRLSEPDICIEGDWEDTAFRSTPED